MPEQWGGMSPAEIRAWADSMQLIPPNAHLPQYSDASAVLSLALVFGIESEQVRNALREYRRVWQPHREP